MSIPVNFYINFAAFMQTLTISRRAIVEVLSGNGITKIKQEQTTTFDILANIGSGNAKTNMQAREHLDTYEDGTIFIQTGNDLQYSRNEIQNQDKFTYRGSEYAVVNKTNTNFMFDDGAGNTIKKYECKLIAKQ